MKLTIEEISYMIGWSMSSKKEDGLDETEQKLVQKLHKALDELGELASTFGSEIPAYDLSINPNSP